MVWAIQELEVVAKDLVFAEKIRKSPQFIKTSVWVEKEAPCWKTWLYPAHHGFNIELYPASFRAKLISINVIL